MNDDKEQARSQEKAAPPQPCCDGGSCCPSDSDAGGKNWKIVVFVLIVIAAGAVLARSLINRSNSTADQPQEAFVAVQPESTDTPSPPIAAAKTETGTEPMESAETPPVPVVEDAAEDKTPEKAAPNIWGPELDSIASLNQLAANVDAVFVFLAAEGAQDMQPITAEIEAAARKIQSKGSRISAFTLKKDSTNYAQLAKQFSTPCVVAMVKGRGMGAVSGEITESKLMQAFVSASRARSACCPGGAPCGPKSGKPNTK
ncbi:MAG: hypothetical protein ACYTEL_15110 [Planctomycetota bacterium]